MWTEVPSWKPWHSGLRRSRPVESCPFPPLRAIYSTVSESQKPPTLQPHPYHMGTDLGSPSHETPREGPVLGSCPPAASSYPSHRFLVISLASALALQIFEESGA